MKFFDNFLSKSVFNNQTASLNVFEEFIGSSFLKFYSTGKNDFIVLI